MKKKYRKITRRDFLKILGFTTLSVTLAACKGPIIESIPYIIKPESITPGVSNYYASTMYDGFDFGNVIIKTRDGRPLKIEYNKKSKYLNEVSSRIQSSILSLYDNKRLKFPSIKKKKISWKKLDNIIIKRLINLSKSNKKIVILTSSLPSPSTKQLIYDFSRVYKKTNHIIYDSISYSSTLNAVKNILGKRAIPYYDFSKIELLISFDADFLGDWSPQKFHKVYVKRKKPNLSMINHIQIESNMSLSGANADLRIPMNLTEIQNLLFEVYKGLKNKSKNKLAITLVKKILKKGNKTLVIADGNKEMYEMALLINKKIKSNALKKNKFILLKESNDKIFFKFIEELSNNKIGALLVFNTNPIYSFYDEKIKSYLRKIPLTISFAMKEDETSDYMEIWAPIHHWLESWGDYKPLTGMYCLRQPTIRKIFNTRQFEDSLLKWIKKNPNHFKIKNLFFNNFKKKKKIKYSDYLKIFFEKKIMKKSDLNSFNKALFHGSFKLKEKLNLNIKKQPSNYILNIKNKKNFELRLYLKTSIGDGRQSDNPWLQELPDPITRTTWENYLTMSLKDAKNLKLKNWNVETGALNGNCVNLIFKNLIIKDIPVYIQPGQAIGTIGLSFGYGRKKGKVTKLSKGFNAYLLYKNFSLIQRNILLKKSSKNYKFSCIQLQNTTAGRNSLAKEKNLFIYLNKKKFVCKQKNFFKKNLFVKEEKNGHHFNLSIDLNKCTGCTACVIACNVENNIPIVGKKEIRNFRDMHWLRVDRYYSSKNKKENFFFKKKNLGYKNPFTEPKFYKNLLLPEWENPKIIFQPIMCQHCNNAPCETVCPVGATTHGKQGQNMMTYNRCIGTRYCANNCPYKVRRFNWFNYSNKFKFPMNINSNLDKFVLNPDVVIRSRGVMEKCSLCIQMTQAVILKAKKEERKIKDDEFQTACSKVCPTNAISFGDLNDNSSKIIKKKLSDRSYKLLDFLGVNPNVFYNIKIRNFKQKKKKNKISNFN
ncbi:MAG: 4Fe-4S dicluster domain-containing protein [Candidatus Karelsulcia muelleri]